MNSSIAVADGQTIALAGLIQTSVTKTDTGIPVLKDIPYAGYLFKSNSVTKDRTELLLLITPHVVRDPSSARAVTDEIRRKLSVLTTPEPRAAAR